jgi:hypothetical protein
LQERFELQLDDGLVVRPDHGGKKMRLFFSIAMLVLVTGCMTSLQRPVVFRVEAEAVCPDWAVVVEVDGRFYCVDRSAFEEPD